MRITKFVHSCLLIETQGKAVLTDPGKYTWDSRLLPVNKLEHLDYIVITHEHSDHYYPPLLKVLSRQFPHAKFVTNNDLARKMVSESFSNQIITNSDDGLLVFEAAHEPLPLDAPVPLNVGVHIDDAFTHPGDAVNIEHIRNTLALPLTAPWISLKQSLERVVELKPRNVIPIHDWYWHKEARNEMYKKTADWLLPHGIKFVPLENAEPAEI